MSIRVDTSSLIPGAIVCGNRGLGVLGSAIPSTGDSGPSYAYNDLSLPADANKEIRGEILTAPSAGTFFAYEDTSFELKDAADGTYTFSYRLYVDGSDLGTATATLVVGSVSGVATATITSISLTPPSATASGTTGGDAVAITNLSSIGLTAPTATAIGSSVINAIAYAALRSISLSSPTAYAGQIVFAHAPAGSGYRRESINTTRPKQRNTTRH